MYLVYRLFLCVTYFGILVQCLGEAGAFDGTSHYANTVIFCSSISCRQYTAIIAGSIVGGGLGIVVLLLCILFWYCRCRRRPSQTNVLFVNATNHKPTQYKSPDTNPFKSGIWFSRWLQFGRWHGPTYISLSFDSLLFKVMGSGADEIGTFTIDGIYSNKTGRMGLTKVYRSGTPNHTGNLDRQIIIQLVWNSEMRQFEGKRYIQTKEYREENKFELKFNKQQRTSPNETV